MYTKNLSKSEINFYRKLSSPVKIQQFLNKIEYDAEPEARSPRYVIRERKAHCFEGALFAASALRQIGYRPLLIDLQAVNDDDHVIAVFKDRGWGAVAKSNFTTLRFREPVYKNLRELVMSYFDFYFNTLGEKTLRSYSLPLNLEKFDSRNWMTTDGELEYIGNSLDEMRHIPLVDSKIVLQKADKDVVNAGLLGARKDGLYKPTGKL